MFASLDPLDLALLAAGMLLLLFGWVLWRAALKVTGGVFGAAIGLAVGVLVAGLADWPMAGNVAAAVGGGLLGALLGAMAMEVLGALAFFVLGGIVSGAAFVALAPLVQPHFPDTDPLLVLIGGATAATAAGGLLFFLLRKFVVALGSAAIGSILVMMALDWPLGGLPLLALFPAGVVAQLLPRRREAEEDEDD